MPCLIGERVNVEERDYESSIDSGRKLLERRGRGVKEQRFMRDLEEAEPLRFPQVSSNQRTAALLHWRQRGVDLLTLVNILPYHLILLYSSNWNEESGKGRRRGTREEEGTQGGGSEAGFPVPSSLHQQVAMLQNLLRGGKGCQYK